MDYIWSNDSIKTHNKTGRTSQNPDEVSQAFIEFCATCQEGKVLDIGAALGVATLLALEKGVTVIANDIEQSHLENIARNCPKHLRSNLLLEKGRFPDDLDYPDNSLNAVLASQVLHFLKGEEIEKGAILIYKWLKPEGKVFVIAGTPYAKNIRSVIPIYKKRKKEGKKWPGEIEKIQDYANHSTVQELPSFFHALNDKVLKDAFERAGFIIEQCKIFARKDAPSYIKLDGRENVMLIAKKPK